tara:strand:+ start:1795 stop:2145 length:351 start_codon:yes stop_codon:yes gene_type:complete
MTQIFTPAPITSPATFLEAYYDGAQYDADVRTAAAELLEHVREAREWSESRMESHNDPETKAQFAKEVKELKKVFKMVENNALKAGRAAHKIMKEWNGSDDNYYDDEEARVHGWSA